MQVVSSLIDFLYTGDMIISRDDTADLQRILDILQINPSLISVDTIQSISNKVENNEGEEEKDSCDSEDESSEIEQQTEKEKDLKPDTVEEKGVEMKGPKRKLEGNEESEVPKRKK